MMFVPSLDRDGAPIEQDLWRERVLEMFGILFRGATALPPGRGVWRDDERNGALLFEDTVVVFAIVPDELAEDDDLMNKLGQFLRTFGREAHQGEVGIIVGPHYLPITNYSELPEQDTGSPRSKP